MSKLFECSVEKAFAHIYYAEKDITTPLRYVGLLNLVERNNNVYITGNLSNFTPGDHGFHVHEFGDISNGCMNTGMHFNPFNMTHGAPTNPNRHVGDLGNVQANDDGIVNVNIKDDKISLNGVCSIIGRAFVLHEKADDMGLGGTEASIASGNAGARIACGGILISKP
uniref:Superoxide dismutase [Cu-Zn] n=1 Tax=Rhabditophanes sp. KR3021 TaxID=114890 RepID=A0AC35TFK2_9BILA